MKERKKLEFLRKKSNLIIDTSDLKVQELKKRVRDFICGEYIENDFIVQIVSFGYKYGIPLECDLTFDVRFIENPFYVANLKKLTGIDKEVRDFVLKNYVCKEFLIKLEDIIKFLLPNYRKEGKKHLTIGIGCTGGQHRSVAISEELYNILYNYKNYKVIVEHRDVSKNII